jgi:hypothetical protein
LQCRIPEFKLGCQYELELFSSPGEREIELTSLADLAMSEKAGGAMAAGFDLDWVGGGTGIASTEGA